MIIKELVHVEALVTDKFDYTVLQLKDKNSYQGKVIFTFCDKLTIGDSFITDQYWSPIWFKDNLQTHFKLMDLKEYLDISLQATDSNSRNFINALVGARHLFSANRKVK